MSNKQVIAIFIVGVVLLLGAFWAGLYVVKQDTAVTTNQNRAANQNSQNQNPQAGRPAASGTATQPQPQPASDSRYVVQVGGSFGTAEKANELTARLLSKYRSARTQNPTGSDTLYRVFIGPYDSREDAQQIANELASQGYKGVMIFPWKGN